MNTRSYIETLYIDKNNLLIKMKDLLMVNDINQLQKTKNDYTEVMQKIQRYIYRGGDTNKIKPKTFVIPERDPHSSYTKVSFDRPVPKRHLKYYNEFKNPVKDHNFLMHRRKVVEEIEPISEKDVVIEEQYTSVPVESEPEYCEYNNESSGVTYNNSYDDY